MKCFEFYAATSSINQQDGRAGYEMRVEALRLSLPLFRGPSRPDGRVTYLITDEAKELLSPILNRYDQDPNWYFDNLNFGRPPVPWAIACLDREYSIAGHIATTRPDDAGIFFAPYTHVKQPIPTGFIPKVGCIVFQNKKGLELAVTESALFQQAWDALAHCPADRHWILAMNTLSEAWLKHVLPGDGESYLASK